MIDSKIDFVDGVMRKQCFQKRKDAWSIPILSPFQWAMYEKKPQTKTWRHEIGDYVVCLVGVAIIVETVHRIRQRISGMEMFPVKKWCSEGYS